MLSSRNKNAEAIMHDCLFCQIAKGIIPSSPVFESQNLYAFLDLNPANKGHTLIIPRNHCSDLFDADPELGKELIETMQRIARALLAVTGAEGFNVIQNNGRVAGQEINHLHWHIIPRFPNDGFSLWQQHQYDSKEEMNRLATAIRLQIPC
ncbi:MAG: HIT family protein [Desulfovibrio sp.]|nr:HIT family protein [Desulfovibrio sp.]